jgi:hypothetical protein
MQLKSRSDFFCRVLYKNLEKSADRKLILSNTAWTIPTVNKKTIFPISAVLKTEKLLISAEKNGFYG